MCCSHSGRLAARSSGSFAHKLLFAEFVSFKDFKSGFSSAYLGSVHRANCQTASFHQRHQANYSASTYINIHAHLCERWKTREEGGQKQRDSKRNTEKHFGVSVCRGVCYNYTMSSNTSPQEPFQVRAGVGGVGVGVILPLPLLPAPSAFE